MKYDFNTIDEIKCEEAIDDKDSQVTYKDMYRMAQYLTFGHAPTLEELRREINSDNNDDTIFGPSLLKEINY